MEIFFEIHQDLERESPGGDEYTRQAWRMLPRIPQPEILDIGCGPGSQTLELARLTDGNITAIDIHQPFLERLQEKAAIAGFSERIACLNQTMFDLPFPENAFDLLWAEGSIYIIGFEQGLKQWRSLIKPEGFLVVSELVWLKSDPPPEIQGFWEREYPAMQPLDSRLGQIPGLGYHLIGHFTLPEAAWWNYYLPLEARIKHLRSAFRHDLDALASLEQEQQEIEGYRLYSDWYGYAFFILQKSPIL